MNWHRFAAIVKRLGPSILIEVDPRLEPLASVITHAITEAEQIPGASGPAKTAHVQNIVHAVAPTIPGVDAAAVDESLQEGIDTVIAVSKTFKKSGPSAPIV